MNVHFHTLVLDGVYVSDEAGAPASSRPHRRMPKWPGNPLASPDVPPGGPEEKRTNPSTF